MPRSPSVILVAALAAAVLGGCSSGADAPADRTIVGTWKGTVNAAEQTFTFGADGSYRQGYTNHLDEGTYETSGDTLRIHVTSGMAGGLPVVSDDWYTGTFAVAADGERMTLSMRSDPPPEDGEPTTVLLQRQ